MKKEIIICLIVIAFVVIGNIVTQNATKRSVAHINTELIQLKEKIMQDPRNEKEINNKIEEIQNLWNENQEILAFYIEHDELEKVETQFFLLKGQIEVKLYEDTLPEIEKCMFILEHIQDKTSLSVKNIF